MEANRCQFPKCNCEVKSGEKFCSPACGELAELASERQLRCDCGHPGCAEGHKT